MKLEKVELGGLRGRQLGARINAVYTEFNQCFTSFANKTYDVLDPDDARFINDFSHFQLRIREMDLKLLAILCQAFDDCNNLESIFKVSFSYANLNSELFPMQLWQLINIVGGLLERPQIRDEFTKKYKQILKMLAEELNTCEEIYDQQTALKMEGKCLYPENDCSPVAGYLRWCNQLAGRITEPIINFRNLQNE